MVTSQTLRIAFHAVRRSLGQRPAASGKSAWAAIREVASGLEELNRSTERDFLAVGGKLMEFLRAAREISADMTALTELVSGEQGRNVSQALTGMLKRAQQMDAQATGSSEALAAVRDLSRRVQFGFLKSAETVALIRAMCTLTRIETSRLGGDSSDFSNLADEVNPLSESIRSTGQVVLDAAARLDRSVESALRRGAEISTRELKQLQALIASVVESLHSFEEREQRAAEASARQAAQHAGVCAGIEDLVGSIQFHDITRQQIEHVCQALGQLRSETGDGNQASPLACAALRLQCSQLSSAGRTFAEAIERMDRDLEGIATRVGDTAEASANLMGFSEGERESFFLHMESCFSGILKAVGDCTAAESALRETASGLEETIGSMRRAVEQIRGIEIQIQRIAINAAIRSAHIGSAGDPLNVLAEVMHRVASNSNQNTEQAVELLDSMSEALVRATGGAETSSSDRPGDVVDQMRQAISDLHSASERSFSRVIEIADLNTRLRDDIRAVRDGLSVGPLFAEVVGRSLGELERIEAQAGSGPCEQLEPGGAQDPAVVQNIDRFARHYTMQAERDIHESVAQAALTAAAAPAESAAGLLNDNTLGDNVELF